MYANVLLPKHWTRLACLCRFTTVVESQKLPQSNKSGAQSSDGITPPARIKRGPTDLLQALAATVGPDPTAAHYKYHDDPYLIPLSNYRKRAYALSAEAGRKAAAWVRDEHAEWFSMREWDPPGKMKTPYFNAEPHIDAFVPKPIYNDESKVTEEDLTYTIKNALIEDSIKVFELLGGMENINDENKLALLQLLCFYNEKEPDSAEWLEERWFSANTRERQAATWKLGGLADKIFTALQPKTSDAYCAVIQGMAKYYQAERAHELFLEALENNIQLSTEVFNSLLGCIGFLKEGVSLRIEALKQLLAQMDEQGISPNDETLTACLRSISLWGGGRQLQLMALQLVAEFRQLDIQPGLSAYYYLLCLFCKERGPRTDILTDILSELEKKENLEPKLATDTNFFITAMGVCNEHLQNVKLADRVHTLLMKGDNYKLVGDAYKESIYYRHLVSVNCRHAPFEKTLELLDTLIPNVYVPEPSVMEEIIKTLELGGAGDRLAQAWSQLVIFGHAKRNRLVQRLLEAMTNVYGYQDEEVKGKLRAAAADILRFGDVTEEQHQQKNMRTPTQKLSATAISHIVELCADTKDKADPHWETVSAALQKLKKEEATGVPTKPEVLADVAHKAAAIGKHGIAATAISYLAECGFEEAIAASTRVLSTILNRSDTEVQELLAKSRSDLESSLQPSVLAVVEAYNLAKSGTTPRLEHDRSNSSSDSDSESSSDDD